MANDLHSELTGSSLHEPKSISTASANQVYVSDGSGSGAWTSLPSTELALLLTPVGGILSWSAATAPSKWELCYGQEISRTTYADLFAVIGTTYGVGDGIATFNLPDCRGRLIAGKDNMGDGTSANRLTGLTGGVNGDVLAATGGAQTHTIVLAEIPPLSGVTDSTGNHTHAISGDPVVRNFASGTDWASGTGWDPGNSIAIVSGGAHTHSYTVNSGGGSAHTNIQPTIILNTIIYHGVA